MMPAPDFDRQIAAWLDEDLPMRAPRRLLERTLETATRTSPRPAWLIPERWIPMSLQPWLHAFPRAALTFVVLALLTAFTAAAIALGSQEGPTALVEPARNGVIAYDSDGDIRVAEPDGTGARTLVGGPATDTYPTWSPDGTRLAFWSQAEGEPLRIGLVAADGTDLRYIEPTRDVRFDGATTYGGPTTSNLEWSPDGTRLLVLSPTGSAHWGAILDLATGEWTVPAVGGGDVWTFRWSPDGSRVGFVAYGRLYVSSPGSKDRPTKLVDHYSGGDGSMMSIEWSPDGKRLVYTTSDTMVPDDPMDLYAFDLDEGVETRLAEGGLLVVPTYSPDGSRLAFGSVTSMGPDHEAAIHVMTADGGDPRVLADRDVNPFFMSWSPDGTRLLTNPSRTEPVGQVKILDPDEKAAPVLIDAPGIASLPDWQPVP